MAEWILMKEDVVKSGLSIEEALKCIVVGIGSFK